jgi:hypothetical protein
MVRGVEYVIRFAVCVFVPTDTAGRNYVVHTIYMIIYIESSEF